MKLVVKIDTDGAAFGDGQEEVNRLLQHVIDEIKEGYPEASLYDYNGNKCGEWKVTGKLTNDS